MTYWLFIDDERVPADRDLGKFVVVRSFEQAIDVMSQRGCPEFISFDHDLGPDEPTGYDIAKWIVEKDLDDRGFIGADFQFETHSQNPIGAQNISKLLESYLRHKA